MLDKQIIILKNASLPPSLILSCLLILPFGALWDNLGTSWAWDKDKVISPTGDAAHATSPQLGQGTNLALIDAVVLAESLEHGLPLAEALDHYTDTRRQHLHFYGQASRWLTPLFQSDRWVLPFLRSLFMNAASRAPFSGSLTREILVGVRQEWTSARALELRGMPDPVTGALAVAEATEPLKPPFEAGAATGRGAGAC